MARRRSLLPRLTFSALLAAATASSAWAQSEPSPPLPPLPPETVPPLAIAPPPGVLPAPAPPPTPISAPHVHGWWGRKHCLQCNSKAPYILPPLGANLYTVNRMQITNNDAARLILRHYDFVDETTELNPYGRIRLNEIIAQAPRLPVPILVEWTLDNPGLDAARRAAVVDLLAKAPIPIDAERVVIGPDMSGRIPSSIETEILLMNQLGRLSATGPAVGVGSGPGAFAGTNSQARPGR